MYVPQDINYNTQTHPSYLQEGTKVTAQPVALCLVTDITLSLWPVQLFFSISCMAAHDLSHGT
jgi:hypothetical protein